MIRLFRYLRVSRLIMPGLLMIYAIAAGCSESTVSTTGLHIKIATVDTGTGIVTGTVSVINPDPVPPVLPGRQDTKFGTNGTVTRLYEHDIDVKAVATQPNGRILVLVTITDPTLNLAGLYVIPFNNDGTFDAKFNDGNVVVLLDPYVHTTAVDLAVQADGKIVVLGDFGDGAVIVGRFTANGATDTGFGIEGIRILARTIASLSGAALAIQEDQKIVITATRQPLSTDKQLRGFSVFRMTREGELDPTLDVNFDITGNDIVAEGMVIQPDGKIVVVGTSEIAPDFGYMLVRLLQNGMMDPDFESGVRLDGLRPWIKLKGRAVALQADGKILMCGSDINTREGSISALFIARHQTDGLTDDPFGVPPGEPGGLGGIGVYYKGRSSSGVTAAVQEDQKIIGLGNSTSAETEMPLAFAVRRDRYGVEDVFFGKDASFALYNPLISSVASDMIIQDDGKAIIAATGSLPGEKGSMILLSKIHTKGLQGLTVWNNGKEPVNATISDDGSWTADLGSIDVGIISAKAIYTTGTSTETQITSKLLGS